MELIVKHFCQTLKFSFFLIFAEKENLLNNDYSRESEEQILPWQNFQEFVLDSRTDEDNAISLIVFYQAPQVWCKSKTN